MLPVSMEDYSTPCAVTAFEGSVVISGPGSMTGAFTADAAEASALLIVEAAREARAWLTLRPLPDGFACPLGTAPAMLR